MKIIFTIIIFVAVAAHADAKKRCYPVPTPVVDPPPNSPTCKKHEVYSACGANGCQSTCENPTLNQVCKAVCQSGCVCKEGYLRDSNGICVLAKNCPKIDEPPVKVCKMAHESYTTCGTACPLTCENPTPGICTKQCVMGCFCDSGYVRNKKGNCVLVKDCPKPKCKPFEIFSDCAPEACKKTCNTLDTECKAPCVPGCKCPEGQVYFDDNRDKCVSPKKCPAIIVDPPVCSGKHERYSECGAYCQRTCGPPTPCAAPPQDCNPGCICDAGYVRETNGGKCIISKKCPK